MRPRATLTAQVTALVTVAVVVSVGIFAAAAAIQGTREVSEAERLEHEASTRLAALATEQALDGPAGTLSTVAASLEDDELYPHPDTEALRRRFVALVPDVFDTVVVLDARGTVFSVPPGASAPARAPGLDISDDGRLRWYVHPPQRDDTLRVVGLLPESAVLDTLYGFKEEGRELAIIDPEGRVVADTLQSYQLDALARVVGEGIRSDAPVGDTGLQLVVFSGTSLAWLSGQVVAAAVVTAGLVIAAGVAVGTVMSRRVTAPVQEVAAVARGLRSGQFDVRVRPRGAPEIEGLGRDINAMADALSKDLEARRLLQEDLAQKVHVRTHQLESRQKEMEQFFYGVSHDIKGPAIGLASILQLLEESIEKPDTRQTALLEQGQASAQQLRRLVDDLLQFAAAERLRPKPRPVDLRDLVRESTASLLAHAQRRGIKIVNSTPRVEVNVDPAVIQRVLQNLVRNAVNHMPQDHGFVQVSAGLEGADLLLKVRDNGAGIPEEVAQRMFTPFARGARAGPGSGIGLSIIRKLVEAHGGYVECHSVPGRGTEFTVGLPDAVQGRARLALRQRAVADGRPLGRPSESL